MGRTQPTATMRVYEFESHWKRFALAPRKVDREAFAELVALAHFHAAPVAHAASPYVFEMILLTMLVGLMQRAQALDARGVMRFYVPSPQNAASPPLFQTTMRIIMLALRQRLAKQKHEIFTFARALRREEQNALRALLAVTEMRHALVPHNLAEPSDEMLLTLLVHIMRRIRQLEKQYIRVEPIVSWEEWSRVCAT